MPVADLVEDKIIVTAEYRDRERIREVPGLRWDTGRQAWRLAATWGGCLQLRGVFGADLEVAPALAAWSQAERSRRVDPCLVLRSAPDAELSIPTARDLYPFQRAGAKFMATAGRALNSDEMGVGKSVQTIAALEEIGDAAYPALIVCPNSMVFVWLEQEIARWAPGRQAVAISGTPAKRRKAIAEITEGRASIGVINWEALRSHTRLCHYPSVSLAEEEKTEKELNQIEWGSIVADEAHRGKDPQAKQTRALWYLGDRAKYVFALTGTPIADSPEDAWAIMRFVSPQEFPVKSTWVERYGVQKWSPFAVFEVVGLKEETKDELFQIMDPRFIRRTKKAVLPQLPDKIYAQRTVELGAKQRKAYDQMRQHMLAELEGGILLASSPLTQLLRLVQFASATAVLDENGTPSLQGPSCKLDVLEELAAELGTEKAVVFMQSVQLARLCSERLEKLGYRNGSITGDVTGDLRNGVIRRFQEGDLQFLVVTLGAGGEGITLTAAQTAIFLQRSFSLVQNLQAEDRLHRIGQKSAVEIIDVVARDTVEARVHEVYREKGQMLEEVVRDEETLKTWLS